MMKFTFFQILVAALLTVSLAFQPRLHACRQATRLRSEETGKGFGKKKVAVKETSAKQPFNTRLNSESETPESTAIVRSKDENLYQTPRARREAELDEKIARLKEEEDLISGDTSVGAVPELIADRMIGRIIAFFGVPVFGGLAIFVGAFFYSKKYDVVVPPSIIAYATQVPFVLGLVGISYAIISSSWDEEPGSLLGFKEFGINFQRIKDGLNRTRENAELRDDIQKEKEKLQRK